MIEKRLKLPLNVNQDIFKIITKKNQKNMKKKLRLEKRLNKTPD